MGSIFLRGGDVRDEGALMERSKVDIVYLLQLTEERDAVVFGGFDIFQF